jgi:exodeoxyribonuclease VII large subunit
MLGSIMDKPSIPQTSPQTDNIPEYSVGEISTALKRTVEETYAVIRVRGEISGFKRHGSGHLYFALKDSDAVLDAVAWRGTAARLGISPEDGMEVVAQGRLSTYPGRSKYQMIVERLDLAGQGALLKLLEDRRLRLAEEGLFDPARKKPIPYLPDVIGIVTSPTGAVIKDILHRLADRFPRHVLLWPVAVQGEGAAAQIAAAIEGFNAIRPGGAIPRPDVLIVARGGGSLEDLWAFNEEIVVRAAANSAIPLISAVGHETDTTLIDYASDLRAPTPTAAAEMAVPVKSDLVVAVTESGARLAGGMARLIAGRRQLLDAMGRALRHPRERIDDMKRGLDDKSERLDNALPNLVARRRADLKHASAGLEAAFRLRRATEIERMKSQRAHLDQVAGRLRPGLIRRIGDGRSKLDTLARLLDGVSYQQVLKRGFTLVRDQDGHPIVSPDKAKAGDRWSVLFQDDKAVPVIVAGAETAGKSATPARMRDEKPRPAGKPAGQGQLF